ncbi:MAG: ABC transporter permease [Thermoplasmata archaeon]|nr:ABC transporter permease [Thermoplasmata archaeon]
MKESDSKHQNAIIGGIRGRIDDFKSRHESRIKETRYSLYLFSRSLLSMVGLLIIFCVVIVALIAPFIAHDHPIYQNVGGEIQEFWPVSVGSQLLPPSEDYWFGTDYKGRDIYSMVLYGAWKALYIGMLVVIPAAFIGILLGALAGYFGRALGEVIMRITDIFLSVPSLVLAMAIVAALGPSITNITIAMIITWWPWYTRLVFGQVLSIREKQFIEASRSVGAGHRRILFKHVIKNSLSPVVVQASSDFGYVILAAAALGWLGLGAPPDTAEWGRMISENQAHVISAWWVVTFPGLAIVITVLGFNLLGDGIRDVLDPKLRR